MAVARARSPFQLDPRVPCTARNSSSLSAPRPAALRLLLTNLLFQAADFMVNRGLIGSTTGWVTPVPGADGTAGLLIANQYHTGMANSGPAVLLQELGLGRPGLPIYLEPNGMGAPKFVTALDLDGDGARNEVVFLMNEGLDGKGGEAGPASLATYRVENTKLTRIDYQKISTTALSAATIKKAAELYINIDGATNCPTVDDLVNSRKLEKGKTNDSWGTPFKIECKEGDEIRVISAGKPGVALAWIVA